MTERRAPPHRVIRTLADIPRYHAVVQPDATAFAFEGRETSFGELQARSSRIAHALLAAGMTKGDRVAYLGKNVDRYFELVLGAAKMGAVVAPIGWRLAPAEAAYILSDSRARLLFAGAECLDLAGKLASEAGLPPPIAIEGEAFVRWYGKQPYMDPDLAIDESDVAIQLYTSGTTGRPKGAMLTHAALLGVRRETAEADLAPFIWTDADIGLLAMPVAHIGGTGWGMTSMASGAKSIIAREFDPSAVLDFIAEEGVSKIFLVPAALQFIVRQPQARQVDYSRLKYILYGAAPIPADLLRECIEIFGCGFCQQYGMTETCGTIVWLPPEDHDPPGNPRMRAAGKPLPGVEIRVIDDAGMDLPAGEVGEIATRSVANMAGYWQQPEASAAALSPDNWLRTGDAGYLDADGYLFIHDRVKDMIISGGENIYPAEVEHVLYAHPDIAEAAVIGIPDPRWGEAVHAVVVVKPGSALGAEDVTAFARTQIAAFKAPKSASFIGALPRNPAGKVLRRELREPYWAGRDRRVN